MIDLYTRKGFTPLYDQPAITALCIAEVVHGNNHPITKYLTEIGAHSIYHRPTHGEFLSKSSEIERYFRN